MTSSRPAERTAASLIVECLEAEGCRWVFSVPGEETLALLDAISRSASVQHVTTRHEQGAAFMADVHGRLTGRVAVALATLGPGATNLLTGIADAYLDRAPMVAITGQASSDKLHKEAHQVVDIVRMFEPVTKWNTRVERVDAVPEIVRKAFRLAMLEQPGVRDGQADRGECHGRRLARQRLRPDRLEAAQRVRPALRRRVRQSGLRGLRPFIRDRRVPPGLER